MVLCVVPQSSRAEHKFETMHEPMHEPMHDKVSYPGGKNRRCNHTGCAIRLKQSPRHHRRKYIYISKDNNMYGRKLTLVLFSSTSQIHEQHRRTNATTFRLRSRLASHFHAFRNPKLPTAFFAPSGRGRITRLYRPLDTFFCL